MRIGIDGRNLVPRLSGIGRYIVGLGRHLIAAGHDLRFYLPEQSQNNLEALHGSRITARSFRGPLARTIWGQVVLPRLAARDEVDLFWGPAHRLPPGLPDAMPKVLTIHDLVWLRAPETMRSTTLIGERLFFARSLRRADTICSDSMATASDLAASFPEISAPVVTVYPGADMMSHQDSTDILERSGIDRPFALFVGTLEPRKNLVALLAAYNSLSPEIRAGCMLVIAGSKGWEKSDLSAQAKSMGIENDLRILDYVSDADLSSLYARCRFLVMPSIYEGFGLPIVEANAFGAPVLTSRISSMPEVVGDAGLTVDPLDVVSIAKGFARLATDDDLVLKLGQRAKANAARFSWENSTRDLVAVFEETIRRSAG